MVSLAYLPFWLFGSHAKVAAVLSVIGVAGSSAIVINAIDDKTKTTDIAATNIANTSHKVLDFTKTNILKPLISNPPHFDVNFSDSSIDLFKSLKKLPSTVKKLTTGIIDNLTDEAIKSHIQKLDRNIDSIVDIAEVSTDFVVEKIPNYIDKTIEWFDKNWSTKTVVETTGSVVSSLTNSPKVAKEITEAVIDDTSSFYNFFKKSPFEKLKLLLACSQNKTNDQRCLSQKDTELPKTVLDGSEIPAVDGDIANDLGLENVEEKPIEATANTVVSAVPETPAANSQPIEPINEDVVTVVPASAELPTVSLDNSNDYSSSPSDADMFLSPSAGEEIGDLEVTETEEGDTVTKNIVLKNKTDTTEIKIKKVQKTDPGAFYNQLLNFFKNWNAQQEEKAKQTAHDLKERIRKMKEELEKLLSTGNAKVKKQHTNVLSIITLAVGESNLSEEDLLLVGQFFGNIVQFGNPIGETESIKKNRFSSEFAYCAAEGKFARSTQTAFGFFAPTCGHVRKIFDKEAEGIKNALKTLHEKVNTGILNKLSELSQDSGGLAQGEKDRRAEEKYYAKYTLKLFDALLKNT